MSTQAACYSHKRFLDILEQTTVLALYVWLIARLWPNELSISNWYPLLILPSEGLVVALLITRRKADRISMNFQDWALALAGTYLVLLVTKGGEPITSMGGLFLILTGLIIHVGAKLSLRRSFGLVAADRGVKSRGLYSFVRHPMYAGYILSHVGFLLVAPSLWNLIIYLAAWSLFIARMFAEERVLSENPEYQVYKEQVPYRVLAGVF